jgi:hypothetical protein
MGSRVMAQSTYQEPVRLMNSSIPTDRRTSQKKLGQSGEAGTDAGHFVTYYLIRREQEHHNRPPVGGLINGEGITISTLVRELERTYRRRRQTSRN